MEADQALIYVRNRIEDELEKEDTLNDLFTSIGNIFVSPWNGAHEFVVTVSDPTDGQPLANVHITVRKGAAV